MDGGGGDGDAGGGDSGDAVAVVMAAATSMACQVVERGRCNAEIKFVDYITLYLFARLGYFSIFSDPA